MSHVLLYKEGKSKIIRGVECDFVRVLIRDIDSYLSKGYKKSVTELYKPTFEEVDTNQSGALSTDEIRAAAKKAGIEKWDTKRVKTLKKELGL